MAMRANIRLAAVWMCAGVLLGAGAKKPGGVAAVQSLYDAGKYSEVIGAADKMLAGANVAPEDRHVVMLLVAQSHLQLKQTDKALEVLDAAHRQAVKQGRPRDAAEAEAFALLIPESAGNVYGGGGGRYNILDAEERRKGYGAMFEERLHHLASMKDGAEGAKTLKPVQEIAREFPSARELEEAATGDVKKSEAFAGEVEAEGKGILSKMMDEYEGRISRIQQDSNVDVRGKIQPKKTAGINDAGRADLHEIITDCQGIPGTIQELSEAFRRAWQMPLGLERAKDLARRAENTLVQNQKVGNGKG